MYYITKQFTFEAAHMLPGHESSPGVEGQCARLHGHSYKLAVTLAADSLRSEGSSAGMVIDFSVVSSVVKDEIIAKLDHRYLNDILPFRTTAENLASYVFETLRAQFDTLVYEVTIWETATSAASVR